MKNICLLKQKYCVLAVSLKRLTGREELRVAMSWERLNIPFPRLRTLIPRYGLIALLLYIAPFYARRMESHFVAIVMNAK